MVTNDIELALTLQLALKGISEVNQRLMDYEIRE